MVEYMYERNRTTFYNSNCRGGFERWCLGDCHRIYPHPLRTKRTGAFAFDCCYSARRFGDGTERDCRSAIRPMAAGCDHAAWVACGVVGCLFGCAFCIMDYLIAVHQRCIVGCPGCDDSIVGRYCRARLVQRGPQQIPRHWHGIDDRWFNRDSGQ